jgi:glycine hydroxymethyltransferase
MGTAALTTRGMKQEEMIKIGETIAAVLRSKGDPLILKQAKETTRKICEGYPLFQQSVTV